MILNPIDLSLYLVLDPDLCGGPEAMVRTARLAAENGATVVQLRAPGWKKKQASGSVWQNPHSATKRTVCFTSRSI